MVCLGDDRAHMAPGSGSRAGRQARRDDLARVRPSAPAQHARRRIPSPVETIWLQRLYVLFFIASWAAAVHDTAGRTPTPSAPWVTRAGPSADMDAGRAPRVGFAS